MQSPGRCDQRVHACISGGLTPLQALQLLQVYAAPFLLPLTCLLAPQTQLAESVSQRSHNAAQYSGSAVLSRSMTLQLLLARPMFRASGLCLMHSRLQNRKRYGKAFSRATRQAEFQRRWHWNRSEHQQAASCHRDCSKWLEDRLLPVRDVALRARHTSIQCFVLQCMVPARHAGETVSTQFVHDNAAKAASDVPITYVDS